MPRLNSFKVYVSQQIRFAKVSGHVTDFNTSSINQVPNFPTKVIGIINFEKLHSRHGLNGI